MEAKIEVSTVQLLKIEDIGLPIPRRDREAARKLLADGLLRSAGSVDAALGYARWRLLSRWIGRRRVVAAAVFALQAGGDLTLAHKVARHVPGATKIIRKVWTCGLWPFGGEGYLQVEEWRAGGDLLSSKILQQNPSLPPGRSKEK